MSEGTRYQSNVEEWAKLINAPEEHEDDLDVYAKKKKYHNSMANMYKETQIKLWRHTSLDQYITCCLVCLPSTPS